MQTEAQERRSRPVIRVKGPAADSGRTIDAEREKFIRSLPKVELHLHAEACLGPAGYAELLGRLPERARGLLPDDYSRLSAPGPLDDLVRRFVLLQSLFSSPGDYALLARNLQEYADSENIHYMEVFVSPTIPLRSGKVDFAGIMDPLVEGAGPDISYIVDLSRGFGADNARNNLDLVLDYRNRHPEAPIVGVGLGGRETSGDELEFRDIFRRAREAGLHTVAHAGEETGPEMVREAVFGLGSERIGHGTSAMFDTDLMAELSALGIPLEICPTSNLRTGAFVRSFQDHPASLFRDAGIPVSINSDDPALFGAGLGDELVTTASELGFGLSGVLECLVTSIRASFMPQPRKLLALDSLVRAVRSTDLVEGLEDWTVPGK